MQIIATRRYIGEAFLLATLLTGLIIGLTRTFTETPLNWFETGSVFFSFACTWLCTRQVRFNYVLAVISTSLLVITFWQAELYGSMALNIYLIPTVIYGWFVWGRDTNPRPVEHVKLKVLPIYLLVTGLTWLGALLVVKQAGGNMPIFDGWILVGTVLAQFLMDRKKLENWLVWIAVNVVSIVVYFQAGLYLLTFQFALFILNAAIAWFQWRRTMRAQDRLEAPEGALPAPAMAG